MSITSLDRPGAAGSLYASRNTGSGEQQASDGWSFGLSLPAETKAPAPSIERLQVDLPNGFTVTATHIGGDAGFSAQLLSSMQTMVDYLNTIQPTGEAPANARCIDTFHAPLSDGSTLDLRYGTESDGGNTDPSAMNAMQKAIEAVLGSYKGAGPHASVPSLADLYESLLKTAG